MQIFISYKREDQRFTARLLHALEDAGHQVWLDSDDIRAGQKWSSAVQEGLDTSDVLLLIATPAAIASDNVADEWQYFHSRKKPIIPIWLRPTEMPYQLDRLQRIDFTSDFDSGFTKLIIELAHIENTSPATVRDESASRTLFSRSSWFVIGIVFLLVIAAIASSLKFDETNNKDDISNSPTAVLQKTPQVTQPPDTTPSITSQNITQEPTSTMNTQFSVGLVTVAQYIQFLNDRSFHQSPRDDNSHLLLGTGSVITLNNSTELWGSDEQYTNNTMTHVTWYGANAYCKAQDMVLPSANDVDESQPTREWLLDGQIAGKGATEIAAKTHATSDIGFRCVAN